MTTGSTEEDPMKGDTVSGFHKANGAIYQNGNTKVPRIEHDATIIPEYSTKGKLPNEIGTDYTFKRKLVWFNIIGFITLHLTALYGLFLGLFAADTRTAAFSKFFKNWVTKTYLIILYERCIKCQTFVFF